MGRRTRLSHQGLPDTGFLRDRLAAIGTASVLAMFTAGALPGAPAAPDGVIEAAAAAEGDPEVVNFYRHRAESLVWSRGGEPTAGALRALEALSAADKNSLGGEPYLNAELRAAWWDVRGGKADRSSLGRFDGLLSTALVRLVADGRRPYEVLVVDPAPVAPLVSEVLGGVSSGKGDRKAVDRLLQAHPDYASLASALEIWRALWKKLPEADLPPGPTVRPGDHDERMPRLRTRLGVRWSSDRRLDQPLEVQLRAFQVWHGLESTGALDDSTLDALNRPSDEYEKLILINLARLRALPATPARRYLKVNIASGELSVVSAGKEVRRMRVVAGRPETPTPQLAAVVRYAVLTPYWNVPLDLVQGRIAPEARRKGRAALDTQDLEVLSDWSASARPLNPEAVEWSAVQQGSLKVRVRQAPGPRNMMGKAKFVLPNHLGIYLHDTPDRSLFDQDKRYFSAGCVRVEDADWLGRWLLGRDLEAVTTGKPEQRVDLADPVPIYILYQTVEPRSGGGLVIHPDSYRRDLAAKAL